MNSLSRSLVIPFNMSWYRINLFNIINLNWSAEYFSLNDIKWLYLISLSIIINMLSYNSSIIESVDFDNLIMKFMITFSQDTVGDSWYWISSYLICVACLFFWQLMHFLIYASIFCFIYENWQCCLNNYIVFETFECFCNDSSWCFLIYLSILFFDIWNLLLLTKNCFFSSLIIRNVALIWWWFAEMIPFSFIFKILWLNSFLFFM